ncbi:MAG: hypothetical protein AB8D78_08520 [Akkermansiaceae bacterium]
MNSAPFCFCAMMVFTTPLAKASTATDNEISQVPAAELSDVPAFDDPTPIPEPAAALLGVIGMISLLRRRR